MDDPVWGLVAKLLLLAAISFAVLGGLIWLTFFGPPQYADSFDPEIRSVEYSASATFDGDRDVWRMEESVALDEKDLLAIGAIRSDQSTTSLRRVRRELAAGLAEEDWTTAPDRDRKFVLAREHDVPLRERAWPPMTTNPLPIGAVSLPKPYWTMVLVADEASEATLVTPKAAVHKTFPAESGRQDRLLDDGTEAVAVPLGEARIDPNDPEIRAKVAAFWLRWELTQPLADFSFQGALKWIVLGVLALGSGWIKRNILEPLVDRVARRARIPRIPAEPQPGATTPSP